MSREKRGQGYDDCCRSSGEKEQQGYEEEKQEKKRQAIDIKETDCCPSTIVQRAAR